jgi:hypothetical protein
MSEKQLGAEQPDPALSAALRAAAPEPPLEAVDWATLHERIQTRARPLLSRPSTVGLWQLIGVWSSRRGLLAGFAAAAIALLLGIATVESRTPGAADAPGFRTIEEELVNAAPAGTWPLLLAAGESDAFLDAALFYETEEW